MTSFQQWGAVLCFFILMTVCQAQTEEGPIMTVELPLPSLREVFTHYSTDGFSLSNEQVQAMITELFSDYIKYPNSDLLEELVIYADTNENGRLEIPELQKLLDYITKQRN